MKMKFPKHLAIPLNATTVLRTLKEEDAPILFTLTDANRVYLKQWLPWLDTCQTPQDSLTFIQGRLNAQEKNEAITFGIWEDGLLMGVISYIVVNEDEGSTCIGYWISQPAQGRGIATLATQTLVTFAFRTLGLRRLTIDCAQENLKSRAIPERLGMKLSNQPPKKANLYGQWVDHITYVAEAWSWRY